MLVRAMDEVDGSLEETMGMLRGTAVQGVLRPKGEEQKSLLDFVDEESVHGMRDAMKKSIEELQVCPDCHAASCPETNSTLEYPAVVRRRPFTF